VTGIYVVELKGNKHSSNLMINFDCYCRYQVFELFHISKDLLAFSTF